MSHRLAAQPTQSPIVVVAGAAGFLGSHICESLLQSGVTVLGLDNLVTGSLRNLESVKQHPHFEFIECNVNQGLPTSLVEKPISHIVHAAGVETHGENNQATLAMALTGAFGTKNLLDLAVSTGARFLLISSANLYEGLASSTSLAYYYGSNMEQEARFSQYEAKRYAEGLCELYAKEYNLDARVARVSQLYGPRMDLRSPELIARLIRSALSGDNLKVDADGSTILVLTYVSDAVYGISRLLFADAPNLAGSIFTFANPEKVSVISVAYTLRDFLPAGKEVTFIAQDQQPEFAVPKISVERVKRDLDWEPSIAVTEGLKQTMESFKKQPPILDNHVVSVEQLRTLMPQPEKTTHISKAATEVKPDLKISSTATQASAKPDALPEVYPEPLAESKPVAAPSLIKKNRKKTRPAAWWKRLFLAAVIGLLYIGLIRPIGQTLVYGVVGGLALQSGVAQAKQLQLVKAEASFNRAGLELRRGQQSTYGLTWLASISGQSDNLSQLEHLLAGAAGTAEGLTTLSQAATPVLAQARQLAQFNPTSANHQFGQTITTAGQTLGQATQQLTQAGEVLSQPVSAKVAGVSWQNGRQINQGILAGWLNMARQKVTELVANLKQAQMALSVLPSSLGQGVAKTYLVMLQNSNELRPTGGFLGSYAIVTVKDGRVVDLRIDDIYNASNKLQSNELAPTPFQQALAVSKLQLLDANWSPDIPTSSAMISKLYLQATGKQVDGVVFVTTQAMKQVLGAIGPLRLDGYREMVTSENFTQLAQIYSDVGFTPGSTAKKDFLTELADQLLARLQSGKDEQWLPIGKAMLASLSEQEVAMWSSEAATEAVLDKRHWSGRIDSVTGDYLRVVDANLGANKANYYVERSTNYAINVDRDSALHGVAAVSWKHRGTSATWPGGDYVNYVRLYVPLGSVLEGSDGFTDNKVTVSQENGKTVFGGFIRVPYSTQRSVVVRYGLPDSLRLPTTINAYTLQWQKQPGIASEPLKITFNAPLFLQAKAISAKGKANQDGSVIWQAAQTKDASVSLKLQPATGL